MGAGAKNRITATMAKYDYRSPTKNKFGKKGIAAPRGADVSEIDRMSPGARLEVIEVAARRRDATERRTASVCSDDPRARLPMAVPGINHTTAIGITPETAGTGRFRTGEKLAAYAGVVPPRRNSGGTVRGGGITKAGSAWLRRAPVNAATVAVRHNDRMRERYERITRRRGSKKARVAVANTSAGVIRHILTNGTEYRTQNKELTQGSL